MPVVIGFDLGLKSTGYCKMGRSVLTYSSFTCQAKGLAPPGARFAKFKANLVEITRPPVDLVVYEKVRRHAGVYAAHAYGGLQALLQLRCLSIEVPIYGVSPGEFSPTKRRGERQAQATKAKASQVVRDWCTADGRTVLTSTEASGAFANDDESDAVLIADWGLRNFERLGLG